MLLLNFRSGKELARKPYGPGVHGRQKAKPSNHGLQLQENKNKIYGHLNERQFRKTFEGQLNAHCW